MGPDAPSASRLKKTSKMTQMMEIAGYVVFGTLCVIVDGEVKSVKEIPSKDDVKKWIRK